MGEVYRALRVDDQYQKEVAIKLIRAGRESAFVVARFKHERQILAKLEHPNIARLLDGGSTPKGVPYLVMELIEGESIIEYCNRRALGIIARLEMFRQVGSAVQFAQQRLIIHRDIKPGNILVTAEGISKLLDFGISKILDAESDRGGRDHTATILRMLTPAYASPEQIKGEPITTASDVYSLGVVLYELLTGRHPYRSDSTSEQMVRAISSPETVQYRHYLAAIVAMGGSVFMRARSPEAAVKEFEEARSIYQSVSDTTRVAPAARRWVRLLLWRAIFERPRMTISISDC